MDDNTDSAFLSFPNFRDIGGPEYIDYHMLFESVTEELGEMGVTKEMMERTMVMSSVVRCSDGSRAVDSHALVSAEDIEHAFRVMWLDGIPRNGEHNTLLVIHPEDDVQTSEASAEPPEPAESPEPQSAGESAHGRSRSSTPASAAAARSPDQPALVVEIDDSDDDDEDLYDDNDGNDNHDHGIDSPIPVGDGSPDAPDEEHDVLDMVNEEDMDQVEEEIVNAARDVIPKQKVTEEDWERCCRFFRHDASKRGTDVAVVLSGTKQGLRPVQLFTVFMQLAVVFRSTRAAALRWLGCLIAFDTSMGKSRIMFALVALIRAIELNRMDAKRNPRRHILLLGEGNSGPSCSCGGMFGFTCTEISGTLGHHVASVMEKHPFPSAVVTPNSPAPGLVEQARSYFADEITGRFADGAEVVYKFVRVVFTHEAQRQSGLRLSIRAALEGILPRPDPIVEPTEEEWRSAEAEFDERRKQDGGGRPRAAERAEESAVILAKRPDRRRHLGYDVYDVASHARFVVICGSSSSLKALEQATTNRIVYRRHGRQAAVISLKQPVLLRMLFVDESHEVHDRESKRFSLFREWQASARLFGCRMQTWCLSATPCSKPDLLKSVFELALPRSRREAALNDFDAVSADYRRSSSLLLQERKKAASSGGVQDAEGNARLADALADFHRQQEAFHRLLSGWAVQRTQDQGFLDQSGMDLPKCARTERRCTNAMAAGRPRDAFVLAIERFMEPAKRQDESSRGQGGGAARVNKTKSYSRAMLLSGFPRIVDLPAEYVQDVSWFGAPKSKEDSRRLCLSDGRAAHPVIGNHIETIARDSAKVEALRRLLITAAKDVAMPTRPGLARRPACANKKHVVVMVQRPMAAAILARIVDVDRELSQIFQVALLLSMAQDIDERQQTINDVLQRIPITDDTRRPTVLISTYLLIGQSLNGLDKAKYLCLFDQPVGSQKEQAIGRVGRSGSEDVPIVELLYSGGHHEVDARLQPLDLEEMYNKHSVQRALEYIYEALHGGEGN
jgi:hypothetical protein